MIRKFFSPPVFEKEEDNFRARFINGFAWVVIGVLLFSILASASDLSTTLVLIALIGIQAIALYVLRRGSVNTSGIIIVAFGWLGLTFQAYSADG